MKVFLFFFSVFLPIAIFCLPLQSQGELFPDHFEFDERPNLYQEFVNTISLEGATSIIDLSYIDGTLEGICVNNGIAYTGFTPYPDVVDRTNGSVSLLDPFFPFVINNTYDWAVAVGFVDFFVSGNEATYVENLYNLTNVGIICTWNPRTVINPIELNPRNPDEVEGFFIAQGFTRDLTMEANLRNQLPPTSIFKTTLFVFRK